MANAMPDGRQEDDTYRRIELITGLRRRRRWSVEEKVRIVAESFEEGANISDVARRHGVARGLLTVRRHQVAARARGKAASFVPIEIAPERVGAGAPELDRIPSAQPRLSGLALPPEQLHGVIDIEVSGARDQERLNRPRRAPAAAGTHREAPAGEFLVMSMAALGIPGP